jgi:hypothetical protein
MSNELVELVVQLYEKNWGVKDYGLARAVVAMCMEEAAKVCDEIESREWHNWKRNAVLHSEGASDGANDCAAAIRALIKT